MPQMRTPNLSRVPQGTETPQGFAPSGIAPGNSPRHQQSAKKRQKLPIWKRLFSIGRKKQPQQNQQSQQLQYNPQPQQLRQPQFGQQPQFNNQPQFSQQPQYNQQPTLQQLPRIPSSAPNYRTRNKPGVPGRQNPAASPYGRQYPTKISRTPRPFPGNAPRTRSRNSQQFQSLFPEQRRINGDAPQFDSFSDQFDPFAIPQIITEPETPPVNSAGAQSQQKSNPFSNDFNPFDEPEESVDARTPSAEPPQQSTTDPTQKEIDPVREPKRSQPKNLAPAPPVSPLNEQTGETVPSGDSLENAFPDLSETEADRNNPDENPFTGLKLGDKPEDFNETSAVPSPQNTLPDAGKDESPRSDDPQNTDENTSGKTTQTTGKTQTEQIKITPAVAPKPLKTETEKNAESSPKIEVSKKSKLSQTQRKKIALKEKREKLKKISERIGLKGFKGFCPVALRDQRELINSKSKFKAIYELRIYYFSASEARDQFENDPEHYAPVHGGKDLVMLRDDEKKVQGSLDHAVWFKDRIYLFSSADSLNTFIKTPKKYSKNPSENESAGDEQEAKDSDDSDSDDSDDSDSVSLLFSEDKEN